MGEMTDSDTIRLLSQQYRFNKNWTTGGSIWIEIDWWVGVSWGSLGLEGWNDL